MVSLYCSGVSDCCSNSLTCPSILSIHWTKSSSLQTKRTLNHVTITWSSHICELLYIICQIHNEISVWICMEMTDFLTSSGIVSIFQELVQDSCGCFAAEASVLAICLCAHYIYLSMYCHHCAAAPCLIFYPSAADSLHTGEKIHRLQKSPEIRNHVQKMNA